MKTGASVPGRSAETDAGLVIHIDGASRGNPGEAGFGVFVSRRDGAEVESLYGYMGEATNNVAEYRGLIEGLRYALSVGAKRISVFSDSELVVRQVSGQYKVKHPNMRPLHAEAKALLARFDSATLSHVRREQNKEADALANKALDLKASKLR